VRILFREALLSFRRAPLLSGAAMGAAAVLVIAAALAA